MPTWEEWGAYPVEGLGEDTATPHSGARRPSPRFRR
jgi:hypothetical protein